VIEVIGIVGTALGLAPSLSPFVVSEVFLFSFSGSIVLAVKATFGFPFLRDFGIGSALNREISSSCVFA
jgi:hypothetical protein